MSVDQLRSVDQAVLHNEAQYFDTNDVEKYNATIGLHKAEDRLEHIKTRTPEEMLCPFRNRLGHIKTRTPEEMLCPFKVYILIEGKGSRCFVFELQC